MTTLEQNIFGGIHFLNGIIMPTFDGIYKHTNGLRKKAFFYLSPPVIFYLPLQGGASFVDHVCLYHTVLSVTCRLGITCWERADL